MNFGEASEAARQKAPNAKASANSSNSGCQGVPKSQCSPCSPRCESSSSPELPRLLAQALELPVAVSARVTAEVWLTCSPGQGQLGGDGVGLHLGLCQGERFLFHCWCCVVSGGGPVSAVGASTKLPWRKAGFQSAFMEVSRKKELLPRLEELLQKKIFLLAKAYPKHREEQAFATAAPLQLCPQAQPGTWPQRCCRVCAALWGCCIPE